MVSWNHTNPSRNVRNGNFLTIQDTIVKATFIVFSAVVLAACQGNTQDRTSLTNHTDSVSYSIGMDIGKNIKRQSMEISSAALSKGIRDVLDSNKLMLTDEQAEQIMISFQHEMMAKQEATRGEQASKNEKEGGAFLEANKTKPGVKTTASGLQYKVIKQGTGKTPSATQTVTVNYKGTLIDGTEFDSSYKRGEPATFPVNGVIKGWTEALQLMPIGSKWELYIPPDLAYGPSGAGGVIPPNATLIFEVELISIK
jgi:FKBP-type peptidyl-prolyl cis-trans isomerase FklB